MAKAKQPDGGAPRRKGIEKRRFEPGDIEPHRRFLAEVPEEVTARRLEKYRLDPQVVSEALPIICTLKRLQPEVEGHRWVHPLVAQSLDDLKNWAGVPNEVALKNLEARSPLSGCGRSCSLIDEVALHALPKKKSFDFERLDAVERRAVRQTANNLLYGYADPEEMRRDPYRGVVDFMLARAKNLWIAVIPDLVVCPDERIEFAGFTTLYFNNVLVYGSGEIAPGNQVKIDAHQIRHIN